MPTDRKLCARLCRECPFKRSSAKGWLGETSGDPWEFLKPHFIQGQMPLPCHLRVNWTGDPETVQARAAEADVCRGYMTFLHNTGTAPEDPEIAAIYDQIGPNHAEVFSDLNEFLLHHHDPEMAARFREVRWRKAQRG